MDESKVHKFWQESDIFSQTIEAHKDNKPFVFFDGPPFATGLPHYGHVLAGFIKDSVLRYAHEQGHSVPRFAGFDTHGLPIEFEIEKELGIKTTQQIMDYGIGNYNEKCRGIVLRYADKWEEIMGRLGRWIDFKNDYKTMTKEFMNSTWWVFSELYKKNRIYEGVRVMPYSTSCGTPLSNFETQQNHKEIQDDSLFIKLPVQIDGLSNVSAMVWTTTPWTLPSNYALCVNPEIVYDLIESEGSNYIVAHELVESVFKKKQTNLIRSYKGEELVGKNYIPPFNFNPMLKPSDYKIISGSFVTSTDGTGIVHIAPSFGADDYKVCIDNGIIQKDSKLFLPMDTNGFVTNDIPELEGTFYKNNSNKSKMDLNTWVVIQLKQLGYYYDKRQIVHNYPFCWRSDTPLIYRAISSWFVKVEDMRERLVELNNQINWIPDQVGSSRFSTWLKSAKDWGVSRNRFWGTPIPIWKSEDGDVICVSSSYELEELAGLEPGSITDLHRHFVDQIEIVKNGKVYKRIPLVLDCWFESGSMPYSAINRNGIVELLRNSTFGIQFNEKSNPYIQTTDGQIHNILPADFIAEGLDQTRGWFYTLLVLSASLFDVIPFKNVIVNGLVLAEDGRKMSKSLKNYPDIMEVVNEYGSDCLRLYLLGSPATRAEPLKFSKSGVRDQNKDIIIPLINSIKFFKEYAELYHKTYDSNPIFQMETSVQLITNPINNWILQQYGQIEKDYNRSMKNYDLNRAVSTLNTLVEVLNNGYIKFGRLILKGKESKEEWVQGLSTLYYVIKRILMTFRAVIPFFCESQYLNLKGFSEIIGFDKEFYSRKSIHLNEITTLIEMNQEQIDHNNDFNIIYNLIKEIYLLRGTNNINLKKPIKSISLVIDPELNSKYSTRYLEHLSFVSDECNIMELKIVPKSQVSITKSISPIKALIFKKHGKAVSTVYESLSKASVNELESIIDSGFYEGFEFTRGEFNINSSIELLDNFGVQEKNLTHREFKFDNFNLILIANLSWDEQTDKLYYYRLVATRIQLSRKLAGLHPWDPINCYYSGNVKYDLEETDAQDYIYNITRIKLQKYSEKNVFYENYLEDLEVKIHLEKTNN